MPGLSKLVLLICFVLLLSAAIVFAEDITITTYYPSPYGAYNQLQTNRLAVGDTNGSGSLDAADQPNRDGDIRLKTQAGDPAAWSAGTTGQFSYSGAKDSLYHYNGSSWVGSGGGGGCYVSYSGGCLAGFTIKASAGSWGQCFTFSGSTLFVAFRPAGGGCPVASGWFLATYGNANVCCK